MSSELHELYCPGSDPRVIDVEPSYAPAPAANSSVQQTPMTVHSNRSAID